MRTSQNETIQMKNEKEKFYKMFRLMDDWMNKKIKGSNIKDYLLQRNYINIAIYGLSYIGQTLINDLESSKVCIKYGIDRDAELYWDTFPIKKPYQITDNVDVIIVTTMIGFKEIKQFVQSKVKCPVISLEEIIDTI